MSKIPRVGAGVHILLFVLAFALMFVRIWFPPALGVVLAAIAAAVLILNLLWLLFTRNLSAVRVLLFLTGTLAAIAVFFVGLFVGLQVNPTGGTVLVLAAAAIFVLNVLWIIRAGRTT